MEKYIPNLFTLTNLFCGFFGIVACLNGDIALGGLMVFWGAFFDVLDGLSARILKVQSAIGKDLDSLADIVTFGALPAIILYFLISKSHADWLYYFYFLNMPLVPLLPFLLVAAGAYRLARFNQGAGSSKVFRGLPIPANGLFFASLPLILDNDLFVFQYDIIYLGQVILNPYLLGGLVLLFSWLMISKLSLFSLKLDSLTWQGNKLIYVFALISIVLFILLLWASIPLIILLYLILSYFNKAKEISNEV